LSSAVVCVHFKTKEDLLYEISRTGNDEALRDTTVSAETSEPAERLSTIGDEQAAGDLGAITPVWVILYAYGRGPLIAPSMHRV